MKTRKASGLVVYAALAANLALAVMKFAGSWWTGSSAMLSEAIHSVVDSCNQSLLLYGRYRASRPPDAAHSFGYGMELFFWGFVVALLIFAFGGALSIYEGVLKIRDPAPVTGPWVNFAILIAAAVFEGISLRLAWLETERAHPGHSPLAAVRASKDPSIFIILMEDAAALCGLAIAAICLAAEYLLEAPVLDGVGSVLIGSLLIGTAALLARETRSLLTGESASRGVLADVRDLLQEDGRIDSVGEILSMHIGPDEILLAATVKLKESDGCSAALGDLTRRVSEHCPQIRQVFLSVSHDDECVSGPHPLTAQPLGTR